MIVLWGLLALLGLSLLIVVHELGHFLAAKRAGIWVEEFGIGLPPRIFGKKIGETIYSLNAFPLGGFVRLHGEMSEEGVTDPKRAFIGKSKKVRSAVIIAGIVMNFVFGVLAFAIFYSFMGFTRDTHQVRVYEVAPASPAQVAGILVDDIIESVDGQAVTSSSAFIDLIETKKGQKVTLVVSGRKVSVTPRETPPEGEGPLGVSISSVEVYYPPVWQRPFMGVAYGVRDAITLGKSILVALGGVARDVSRGQAPQGLVGPAGITGLIAYFFREGIFPALNFLGLLSVNLAILNIIPFPPLDGSRLLFLGFEAIFGKRVLPKIESVIHSIGMAILVGLMLLITAREIPKILSANSLSSFVDSLVK